MLESKAIQLFLKLDDKARRALRGLIQSSKTCPNKRIRLFWAYFFSKKYLSKQNTTKKKVFAYCFDQEVYEDAKLRRLASISLDFLETNVRYFEKKENEIDVKIKKIDFYRKNELPLFATALFRSIEKDLEALPFRDESYYLQKYLVSVQRFEWMGQEDRLEINNLQQLTQDLNHFYTISVLKYACIGLTHQNLRQATYNMPLLDSILQQIEANRGIPIAVLVYYHAFKALQDERQTEHFQALKEILLDPSVKDLIADFREVLLLAINYCIKRINSGETPYIRETFELYLFGLENQVLVKEGGYLSRFTFKNIIALAIGLEEFDLAKDLIAAAATWLEPAYVAAQVSYNTAKLYFHQHQFDEAIVLLQQVEFDDIFINMDAKVMLLKMYYTMEYIGALEALLNSFDVFLHRKKILSYHRQNYHNIVRLFRKLVNTPSFDKEGKAELKKLVLNTKPLTEQKWLLQQLR